MYKKIRKKSKKIYKKGEKDTKNCLVLLLLLLISDRFITLEITYENEKLNSFLDYIIIPHL